MHVFVTAVRLVVCVAAPAKNAQCETKRRALVGYESSVRLPKMRVLLSVRFTPDGAGKTMFYLLYKNRESLQVKEKGRIC